jgi:GTP-binding protein
MQQEIRNIAIIAHVDHGKTTLTDALMQQCGTGEAGQTMDSNPMEKERGITITAKKYVGYLQRRKDKHSRHSRSR